MHALHKFRQYLVCERFIVKTYHKSVRFFLNQRDLNDHQQKWVRKLKYYDFDIEYVKGKNNVVANALSRKPTLCSLTSISIDWKVSIILEYAKDSFATKILDNLVDDNRYKVVDEIIYFKNRMFLVPGSKTRERILRAFHDTPLTGHQGYFKTYRQFCEKFSWKGMK